MSEEPCADPVGWIVPSHSAGTKLVDVLKRHLPVVPVRDIGALLHDGALAVDGRAQSGSAAINRRANLGEVLVVCGDAIRRLADADRLILPHTLPSAMIVFEDEDLVVVDKAPGQHVHPMGAHRGGTMLGMLAWHAGSRMTNAGDTIAVPWGSWRGHPVHRLDRATGGLVAVAKSPETARACQELLAVGHMQRQYLAEVEGRVLADDTITSAIGGDPAQPRRRATGPDLQGGQSATTHFRVLDGDADRTRLLVTLGTGRTHQIRVHLASIGHPVLGDTLYGAAARSLPGNGPGTGIQIRLHATSLTFPHPRSGEVLTCRSSPKWLDD